MADLQGALYAPTYNITCGSSPNKPHIAGNIGTSPTHKARTHTMKVDVRVLLIVDTDLTLLLGYETNP